MTDKLSIPPSLVLYCVAKTLGFEVDQTTVQWDVEEGEFSGLTILDPPAETLRRVKFLGG